MVPTRSKAELLQQMTALLFKHNPMSLDIKDELEYENEALSILSRFTEASVEHAQSPDAFELALGIVNMSMHFWFDDLSKVNTTLLTADLFACYLTQFSEKANAQEVAKEFNVAITGSL
jgi:hypothetical protein